MRKMKDSGIEWIGKIPLGWRSTRLKFICKKIADGSHFSPDTVEEGYPYLTAADIHGKDIAYDKSLKIGKEDYMALVKAGCKPELGDTLLVKDGATTGRTGILKKNINCVLLSSVAMLHGKNNIVNDEYLWYALQNPQMQEQISFAMAGSAMPRITLTKLREFILVVPPLSDQDIIVRYLDTKCSQIDTLSANIQKEIDTLEKYKRSVITEVVTKGMDKNVEMKESGIPFIGAIPAHWKSDKLKYHLQRNEPRNPGEQEVLSLYRDYGIVPKDSRDDNFNVTSEDTSNYKYVRVGDFVINKMKAWQGSVAVSDYEGIVSPAYYVYKFTDGNIYRRYFHYLLRACYKDEFMRLSGGIRVGQWDLSATALENTYILLPPYEEQVRIADYLDDKKKDIDDAIASKHDQLATLDAYKKSTIYEYVTGKKEVPAV